MIIGLISIGSQNKLTKFEFCPQGVSWDFEIRVYNL